MGAPGAFLLPSEGTRLVGTLWVFVWTGAAALALAATVRFRRRVRTLVDRRPVLDDEDVRRILEVGVFVSDEDEPLDLEQVHEEERRFWEDAEWDEAEEW
jgi:hypothetical protein